MLLGAAPRATAQSDDETELLRQELRAALAVISRLEARVSALEAGEARGSPGDDLEAQLQGLIVPEPAPAPRTLFPSAGNPRIGVFMDTVAEAGNAQESLGQDGDRFSLREVEVDIRVAISPFADGVFITTFEDEGNGEYHTTVEEGYADVALGALLSVDTAAQLKIGRFRVPFGTNNKLHTHDLPQVDRPYAVSAQLGPEGLIGDGVEATLPLFHSENEQGLGRTTRAQFAVVNGQMFTGDESLLGEMAGGVGLGLESDAPVLVGRLSHFIELDELADLEFGASTLTDLGSNAVRTDVGSKIDPSVLGADVTLRLADDETRQGSWLFQAEAIRSQYDFGVSGTPGFPVGNDESTGYWFTAQRQTAPTVYVGLRVGQSDVLGTDGSDSLRDVSPYVTWYADEFFRLRLQGQHMWQDASGSDDQATRVFLQGTWNFGAHQPHPYWTNR